MRSPFLLLCFCFMLFIGCSKKKHAVVDEPAELARQELNVAYGTDAMQKMDVYFPEGYGVHTPVVFLIHGGGFIAGNKEDFTDNAKLFMEQGFVAVNLDHRLVDAADLAEIPPVHKASAIKVKDQVDDLASAVAAFKASATDWGVGTSKMYMAGHSVGGTLAMLFVQGEKNADVRASGNLAGLTNVTLSEELYNHPPDHELWPNVKELLYRMSGQEVIHDNALALMAISPNWVTFNNKPGRPNITVMPASNDEDLHFAPFFSSVNDAEDYHKDLKVNGVASEYKLMDTDHGFGNHPGDWKKAVQYTADFFKNQ